MQFTELGVALPPHSSRRSGRASLGIGGIAIALAMEKLLGDLFSSLSIVLDKPFVVGDFIKVGDFSGSVEFVGLKTTRIRGLGGEQIVFCGSPGPDTRKAPQGRAPAPVCARMKA